MKNARYSNMNNNLINNDFYHRCSYKMLFLIAATHKIWTPETKTCRGKEENRRKEEVYGRRHEFVAKEKNSRSTGSPSTSIDNQQKEKVDCWFFVCFSNVQKHVKQTKSNVWICFLNTLQTVKGANIQ